MLALAAGLHIFPGHRAIIARRPPLSISAIYRRTTVDAGRANYHMLVNTRLDAVRAISL